MAKSITTPIDTIAIAAGATSFSVDKTKKYDADGSTHTYTAYLKKRPECIGDKTPAFTAPLKHTVSIASLDVPTTIPCGNTYDAPFSINFANMSGELIIKQDGVNVGSFTVSGTSPYNGTLTGLIADGNSHDFTATFTSEGCVSESVNRIAPVKKSLT